ncbi:MAG: hypothetical protein ACJ8EJ_01445 [Xanthobacteraceae bacterium]
MPAKHDAREAESAQAQTLLTMSWSIFNNALTCRGGAQGRVTFDARTHAAKRLACGAYHTNPKQCGAYVTANWLGRSPTSRIAIYRGSGKPNKRRAVGSAASAMAA